MFFARVGNKLVNTTSITLAEIYEDSVDLHVQGQSVPITVTDTEEVQAVLHLMTPAHFAEQIRESVQERMTEQQRKFFLRQQLEEIQRELGISKDDRTAELDRFKERLATLNPPEKAKARIDEEMDKLDHWAADQQKSLRTTLKELDDQIKDFKRQIRQSNSLPEKIALQKKVKDTTTTGKPRYQQDGLIAQITSNVLEYGASLDQEELFGFMTDVHSPMYSGGNKRMVLASADLLASVNNMATDAIRITTRDTTWGPNITEVQFAGKIWQFVEAPALSDRRPGWGIVIHPTYLKLRTLIPTRYEMNVQNPIDKFYKDGFYTVQAIEVRLEEVFGILKP